MDAGPMDKRVTLEELTQGKDASGGRISTWTPVTQGTIAARVLPMNGNERSTTSKGGEVSEARTEFAIRYRPGVTSLMRVVYKGAYYNIKHVKNVNEANETLILTCDTGVNDG
ncbi:phage head closure protein [Herbaspirillum sp. GCM10030257]|uniref:phage head closure protein n=1 Tax=Herbaspirillum sp. GCM10030257 TaxID=3273393 RepID=UPI0036202FF6